ncbi:Arm DNA-binding domain-containing protein [Bacteroides sp.]
MVRSSFSILFAIRENKARKSGKAPIEITITVNGDRCTLSTGKQVAIDKWDNKLSPSLLYQNITAKLS